MATGKVLVIDDELHIRMLYQEELETAGYVVAVSDGSDDILPLLQKEKPDVVVLDIKLGPDRSGLDLLQEIRRDNQDIPVILCTAYDSFQQDFKSIAADYYVVKSVDSTELLFKIAQAMAKAKKKNDAVSSGNVLENIPPLPRSDR
jgi:DNA-binding NtrC family response regulator